jgi:hypothetical protein
MKLEKYPAQQKRLPVKGKHIIGYLENENIIVYQAFNSQIAEYAVAHRQFGGAHYSFNRMSWIKPGFLWMMHRAGWAAKENQQRILAISLPVIHFQSILGEATLSSYDSSSFATQAEWKSELERTEVRLQWDPDHDPYGNKQERKAIQVGMKGAILKQFCTEWITRVEDITDFVHSEHDKVVKAAINELNVPYEEVLELNDPVINKRIGVSSTEQ